MGAWGMALRAVAVVGAGIVFVTAGPDGEVKAIPAPVVDIDFDTAAGAGSADSAGSAADSMPAVRDTIVLSAGTFWGTQAIYLHVNGVVGAATGYTGGRLETANYDSVSLRVTGHAHSVQVIYDPAVVSLGDLLRVFFGIAHDPTSLNKQGSDRGTQYRSAIWYRNEEQRRVALAYIAQLDSAEVFRQPIVTEVNALVRFYTAERWHQDFVALYPDQMYTFLRDVPKIENLERVYPELWRAEPVPWSLVPITEDTTVIHL